MSRYESPNIAQRVREVPLVGSRVYEEEVLALKRQGKDILALSVQPVRDMPAHIIEAAAEAAKKPIYPPSRGLPELRQALAEMVGREIGGQIDPDREVLITNGAMQGQYVLMTALLDPGDEVIIPSPCFFFHPMVKIVGGKSVLVPMAIDNFGYRLDLDRIEAAITPRTKFFLLNTPQNPTGYVVPRKDLERIKEMAEAHNLLIVSDESYERMVYDGRKHEMILSLPGMRERTILVRSFTKTFSMGAWRMGYLVAPEPILNACQKVIQWMNLTCNYVCQRAAWAAVVGPQDWLATVPAEFEANRNALYEVLLKIDGLSSFKPWGGPFAWINVSELAISSDEFCLDLLRSFGVLATAGQYFDAPDHIRIPFGGLPQTIAKLGERLAAAASKHLRK